MSDSLPSTPSGGVVLRTEFVRHRNALLVRGSFSELFVDYYLHLADHSIRLEPEVDARLKAGLVAMALHAAARPHKEIVAWTINFQAPLLNLFLCGDNEDFTLVGCAFTDNVRVADRQLIYSDVVRDRGETRRSTVPFEGDEPFAAAVALYSQSEQRPARFFDLGNDDYALLVEHPDCDAAWFASADVERLRAIDTTETVVPIERRRYTWSCGCSDEKLMRVLATQMRAAPDELFGDDEVLHVQCPRCFARYAITREALEAWVAKHPAK